MATDDDDDDDDLMIAFSLAAAQVSSGLGAKAGGLRRK